MTDNGFTFTIGSIPFDEDYRPADNTRITTNFANLARGNSRRDNLRNTLRIIDNRFNSLMHWDNPTGDRYSLDLTIISAALRIGAQDSADAFPLIEILQTTRLRAGGLSVPWIRPAVQVLLYDCDWIGSLSEPATR